MLYIRTDVGFLRIFRKADPKSHYHHHMHYSKEPFWLVLSLVAPFLLVHRMKLVSAV